MNWRARSRPEAQRTSCKALWPPRPTQNPLGRRKRTRRPPASRSRSTGGTEVAGSPMEIPSSAVPGTLKIAHPSSHQESLSTSSATRVQINLNPPNKRQKRKKNKQKKPQTTNHLPWGLPPASRQGALSPLLPPKELHRRNPKHTHEHISLDDSFLFIPPRPTSRRVQWRQRQPTDGPRWSGKGRGYEAHAAEESSAGYWRREFCLFSLEIW